MTKRNLILLALFNLYAAYGLPGADAQSLSSNAEETAALGPAPASSNGGCLPRELLGCNPDYRPGQLWVGAEYLLWWIKDSPSPPPLTTTGPLGAAVPGAISQPGTSVLLGAGGFDDRPFSGGRFTAGFWLDSDRTWGVEAIGLFLGSRSTQQSIGSSVNGNPPLFRPLSDVSTGENSFFLSSPGFVAGNLTVRSTSELWGLEANAIFAAAHGDSWQLAGLIGYRHLNLDESLNISTFTNDFGNFFGTGFLASPSNPGNFEKIGSTIAVADNFHTRNQFDGGQLGGQAQYDLPGGVYIDVRATVALGNNHQTIDIGGSTVQTQPGLPTAAFSSGVLANPSNSGHFQHDAFSVVPTVGIRLGYQLTEGLRAFVAYDFFYWSDVVRPGDQVSRSVDFRSIPTAFAYTPGFAPASGVGRLFQQSDFWAQGISFGLEYRY